MRLRKGLPVVRPDQLKKIKRPQIDDYWAALCALWPSDAGRRCLYAQHPPRSRLRNFRHFLHTTPLCRNYEKRFPVRAPEHACEAAAINGFATPRRLHERARSACSERRRTRQRCRHRCKCRREYRRADLPIRAGSIGFHPQQCQML